MESMDQTQLIVSIVSVVIGLILCLFGLKLVRVLTVIAGLIIGGVLGYGIAVGVNVDTAIRIVIIAACAVLLGIVFFLLRRVGMFFVAFLMSAAACAVVLMSIYAVAVYEGSAQISDYAVFIFIGVAISLIAAILAAIFMEPLIIIVTAIQGGLTAGITGASLLGLNNTVWAYVIAIVLVILGMWLQFWMHSRKIGREEAAYAEKVRKENSIESEVEQARSMLDDDDEDEDEDEDK